MKDYTVVSEDFITKSERKKSRQKKRFSLMQKCFLCTQKTCVSFIDIATIMGLKFNGEQQNMF